MQISAKSGDGVDELLETLLLLAELEELKANPDKPARGTVIEAHMDRRCRPSHSQTGRRNLTKQRQQGVTCGMLRPVSK